MDTKKESEEDGSQKCGLFVVVTHVVCVFVVVFKNQTNSPKNSFRDFFNFYQWDIVEMKGQNDTKYNDHLVKQVTSWLPIVDTLFVNDLMDISHEYPTNIWVFGMCEKRERKGVQRENLL